MLQEFKEFAIKGNVIDMAVGIIIGASFTTIVTSLVEDIIMPPLALVTGDADFADKFILLSEGNPAGPYETIAAAKTAGAVVMAYGNFLNAVVSFLMVAIVLFFMVRWMNRLRRSDTPAAPTTKSCEYCKSSIDLSATRCAFCTAELAPSE